MVGKGVAGERTHNQISFWEIYKQDHGRRKASEGGL